MAITYVRRLTTTTGITDGTEDTTGTFAGAANTVTEQDITADAGEIWLVTAMAHITTAQSAGDDLYMYITDGTRIHTIDSDINNLEGTVHTQGVCFISSSKSFLRIKHVGDAVGGARTITYWYQAVKLS
jgi:hypothetical protein